MMKKLFSERKSAAEEVAGSEGLVYEILLRSPAKSLIRFQLVSKRWLSLISDPQFARNHTRRRNPNSFVPSGLFFYNSPTGSLEIESVSLLDHNVPNQPSRVRLRAGVPSLSFLDPVAEGAPIKILQSCNGLLLCCFTFESSGSVVSHYCVCNPTTKKYTILPHPSLPPPPESIINFILALDPTESPHYRVVCVRTLKGSSQIDIYSSKNGSWRSSVCRFAAPVFRGFHSGVHSNGGIHWTCHYRGSRFSSSHFSVHFNINSEELTIMETPQSLHVRTIGYFGECCGHLHLINFRSINHVNSAEQFDVLEMDRDTFRWSVRYQVDMNRIISAFPEIVLNSRNWGLQPTEYALSVLCVVKGDDQKDLSLLLAIPGKVISYNLERMRSKVLCELPSQVVDTTGFNCVTAYQYIETLSSV